MESMKYIRLETKHKGYKIKFTWYSKKSKALRPYGYCYGIKWLEHNVIVSYSYHASLYKMVRYFLEHSKVMFQEY